MNKSLLKKIGIALGIVALFLEDFGNYCDGLPLKRRVERGKGY